VRHHETNYDSLLAKGLFRGEARAQVRDRVEAVLEKWCGKEAASAKSAFEVIDRLQKKE